MSFNFSPKIVTNGLVTYYDTANQKSYIGGGTIVNDLIGNNVGTLINGITADTINGVFDFDGINDYINCGINSTLFFKGTSNFTLSAWINVSSLSTQRTIFSKFNAGVTGAYHFNVMTNGLLNFHREIAPFTLLSNTVLSLNQWYYCVATYDGINKRIYLNGVLDSTPQVSGAIGGSDSTPVLIGAWLQSGTPATFFNGQISLPIIYNRALPENEILQNYNAMRKRFGIV